MLQKLQICGNNRRLGHGPRRSAVPHGVERRCRQAAHRPSWGLSVFAGRPPRSPTRLLPARPGWKRLYLQHLATPLAVQCRPDKCRSAHTQHCCGCHCKLLFVGPRNIRRLHMGGSSLHNSFCGLHFSGCFCGRCRFRAGFLAFFTISVGTSASCIFSTWPHHLRCSGDQSEGVVLHGRSTAADATASCCLSASATSTGSTQPPQQLLCAPLFWVLLRRLWVGRWVALPSSPAAWAPLRASSLR